MRNPIKNGNKSAAVTCLNRKDAIVNFAKPQVQA
jgi:hypothetical protein